MSGSTIGGVVGAVVGSFIPGVGTQLGGMLGSALGGYVDPEKISQSGPRLTDTTVQTSRDGIPIPFGYGTFPTSGNIIWCGPVVEGINTTTEGGKGGGPEVTTTTYVYLRAYAIGICQGPISGLLVVKRNGKVIYDVRTTEELTALGYTWQQISEIRALTSAFIANNEIYLGDETQVASPTIEAHEGVGNVPAMRGLAYFVVPVDNVTDIRGAVPQYEFVVAACGEYSDFDTPKYLLVDSSDATDYSDPDFDDSAWPTGVLPMGTSDRPDAAAAGFPEAIATLWPLGNSAWFRATFHVGIPADQVLSVFLDDAAEVWINGVLVFDHAVDELGGSTQYEWSETVTADKFVVGANKIAVKARGDLYAIENYVSVRLTPA